MLRYYPSFKVITNQNANPGEFINQDGTPYSGKYYITYDGRIYSGPTPQVGPSKLLKRTSFGSESSSHMDTLDLPYDQKLALFQKTNVKPNRIQGKPNSYYPQPVESDYKKGYLIRYFTKKENEKGYIIEISQDEYNMMVNGTADFDTTIYQTTKILWKITGPLNSKRESQYNIIPGIIDTNKRLVEEANKTFLGITEFIGGEYTKYAKPTQ